MLSLLKFLKFPVENLPVGAPGPGCYWGASPGAAVSAVITVRDQTLQKGYRDIVLGICVSSISKVLFSVAVWFCRGIGHRVGYTDRRDCLLCRHCWLCGWICYGIPVPTVILPRQEPVEAQDGEQDCAWHGISWAPAPQINGSAGSSRCRLLLIHYQPS